MNICHVDTQVLVLIFVNFDIKYRIVEVWIGSTIWNKIMYGKIYCTYAIGIRPVAIVVQHEHCHFKRSKMIVESVWYSTWMFLFPYVTRVSFVFLYQCLMYADCHVCIPILLITFLSLERQSSTSTSSVYIFTLYVLYHLIRRILPFLLGVLSRSADTNGSKSSVPNANTHMQHNNQPKVYSISWTHMETFTKWNLAVCWFQKKTCVLHVYEHVSFCYVLRNM